MAKLSRTQRFADLRNRLENESQEEKHMLDEYENKLNDIQNNIKQEAEQEIKEVSNDLKEEETKIVHKLDQVESNFDQAMDELLNTLETTETDHFKSYDNIDNELHETFENSSKLHETFDNTSEVSIVNTEENAKNDSADVNIKKEDDQAVSNETNSPEAENNSTNNSANDEDELFPWFKNDFIEEDENDAEPKTNIASEIQHNDAANVVVEKQEEPKIETVNDDYLKETLNEVDEYNKSKGLITAADVPTTILDEIRGNHDSKIEETAVTESETVEENKQKDDDDTVTMEIRNILASLEDNTKQNSSIEPVSEFKLPEEKETSPATEENKEINNFSTVDELMQVPHHTDNNQFDMKDISDSVADMLQDYLGTDSKKEEKEDAITPIVKESIASEEPKQEETPAKDETLVFHKEEHPVLTKTLSEEETLNTDTITSDSLLNETRPFIVEKKDIISQESIEETDAPNKILNIALAILIIALIAVIGFVIYGLLKTKGII